VLDAISFALLYHFLGFIFACVFLSFEVLFANSKILSRGIDSEMATLQCNARDRDQIALHTSNTCHANALMHDLLPKLGSMVGVKRAKGPQCQHTPHRKETYALAEQIKLRNHSKSNAIQH
jgi:hypothetical protein